jgi:MFS family permease
MADVDVQDVPVVELVQRLSDQSTTLLRQEMRLIQAEMGEKAKQAGAGAGLMTAAAVLALGAFGALVAGVILAIGEALALWLSAFIVTAGLLIVAAVVALAGKRKVAEAVPPKPVETIDSLRADVAEIKEAAAR